MLIRRNLVFNTAGVVLPLVAAVISIPLLITHLGLARFGVLSVLLAAMTYIGLLDLGLGSAVTYKLVPLMRANAQERTLLEIIRTTLTTTLAIGAVIAGVIFLASTSIAKLMNESSAHLTNETVWSVRIFALTIPALFATSTLAGTLAAAGRFDELNKVRIPLGVASYLGPALTSVWTSDLSVAVAVLCIVRTCGALIHAGQCRRLHPGLFARFPFVSLAVLKSLFQFGGWMTVSNVVGPLMVYMDRFYVGAIRSFEDVARYVTPYEVATKVTLIPASVLPVLFPLFVSGWTGPNGDGGRLTVTAAAWTAIGCAFPAAVLAVLAPQLLQTWLGSDFSGDSAVVLQVLAGGVLANCVAQVFFVQIQSSGRTDIIAKIHVCELAGYLILLWVLAERFGIVGVAIAWSLRVLLDGALFCWLAGERLSKEQRRNCWSIYLATAGFAVALSGLGIVESWANRALVILIPLAVTWFYRANCVRLFAGNES